MDQKSSHFTLLEYFNRPAFFVQDGLVVYANQDAQRLGVNVNTAVETLFAEPVPEYSTFTTGTLHCSMQLHAEPVNVVISKLDQFDLVVIDKTEKDAALDSLSLAANQLRKPLSDILAVMESTFFRKNANTRRGAIPISKVNRGLLQINRQISNMADVVSFANNQSDFVTIGIRGFFLQIMEKAATLLKEQKTRLLYEAPQQEIYMLADPVTLERALYNLISNAVKYAPSGTRIHAKLTQADNHVSISIQAEACNNEKSIRFDMYKRQPNIEDYRTGLGLGLTMVRAAVMSHGGTLLIDNPENAFIRVTATLPIRIADKPLLRSPAEFYDYAGGIDHALLELSDVLPAKCYRK